MNEATLQDSMASLGNALDRFDEALAYPDPDELVDGTIQRFEHVYNAEMARELFMRLPAHYQELRDCFEGLKRRAVED